GSCLAGRSIRKEAAARPPDSRWRPRDAGRCNGPGAAVARAGRTPPALAVYLLAALLDVLEPPALRGIQPEVGAHRNGYRCGDDNEPDPWIDEQQDETDDDATDRYLCLTRHVASSRARTRSLATSHKSTTSRPLLLKRRAIPK